MCHRADCCFTVYRANATPTDVCRTTNLGDQGVLNGNGIPLIAHLELSHVGRDAEVHDPSFLMALVFALLIVS